MNSTTYDVSNYKNLETKLKKAQKYVLNRYKYYNDEQVSTTYVPNSATRSNSDAIKTTIDDIRNNLLVDHFINAKSIQRLFNKNFMNKIIKSSLISGCAFARVIKQPDDSIELIPYDAMFCTGILNNNNTFDEAITVDDTNEDGSPLIVTHYTKELIITTNTKTNRVIHEDKNTLGIIPVIPIIFNQNALKPYGSSFITKKMMRDTDSLRKNKQRADIVNETLTQANTYALGVAKDFKNKASAADIQKVRNIVMFTKDADGDSPSIVHTENGATTLEQKTKDLEASIKYDCTTAEYANMIVSIQQDLVDCINIVGDTIIKYSNNSVNAKLNKELDIVFKNNDFSNFSPFMDGVLKVNQVVPGYLEKEQLDKILGINGNKSPLLKQIKEEV